MASRVDDIARPLVRVCEPGAQDFSQEPWAGALDAARGALEALILKDRGNRREAATWLVEECSRKASPVRSVEDKMQIILHLLQAEVESCKQKGGARLTAAEGQARTAQQLLTLVCEQTPQLVAPYFSSDSDLLRAFFRGDARRMTLWFDHFQGAGPGQGAPLAAAGKSAFPGGLAGGGGPGRPPSHGERTGGAQGLEGHQLGARSLARFVFRHREEYWHLLCWRGRHAQSPVSVVSRPQYLADLDVPRTVEALLREAPDFWSSPELRAELGDGSFLGVDLPFFVHRLERALLEELAGGKGSGADSRPPSAPSSVLSLVQGFLATTNFAETLQRVLPLAGDAGLLSAANGVAAALSRRDRHSCSTSTRGPYGAGRGGQGPYAQVATTCARRLWERPVSVLELGQGRSWPSLDALLLCCACVPGARQALRLLRDPEWAHLRAQALEGTRALGLLLLGSGYRSASATPLPILAEPCREVARPVVVSARTEATLRVCLASFAVRLALLPPAFWTDAQEGVGMGDASAAWQSALGRLLAHEGIEFRGEGEGSRAGDSYELVSEGEEEVRPKRGAGKCKRRRDKGGKARGRRQQRPSEEPEAGLGLGVRFGRGASHSPPPGLGGVGGGASCRWRLAVDDFEAAWGAVRPQEGAPASRQGRPAAKCSLHAYCVWQAPLETQGSSPHVSKPRLARQEVLSQTLDSVAPFGLAVQGDVVDLLAVLCFRSAALQHFEQDQDG